MKYISICDVNMAEKQLKLLLLALIYFNITNANVIVETKSGLVSGKEVTSILPDEKYYSFLGIPYAEPPVGELRFMAPKPHSGWGDVLECNKEKSSCAQYFLPVRQHSRYGFYGDEDCLTLSIHTPNLPNNENPNLPVIVFLMNEQFRMSYNITKDYGPDFFMSENVIIVTVNHRLGSLGFLSNEDDVLPGNNGLRDVILALKWLRDNVDQFGGDSNRITLMGNQGGAVVIDSLLHTPISKGLFSAAILQSGSSWNSMYFAGKGTKRAKELSESLEKTSPTTQSLLKNLANIAAPEITEAELRCVHADEARENQNGIIPFIPVVEPVHPDAIITKLPEESTIDIDVPVMIGYNSRESLELCERFLRKPQYLTFADRDFLLMFPIRTQYNFKLNDAIYREAIQEIKDFYLEEGYVKISKPGEYMDYIGDVMAFYAVDYTVRKYTNESKAPVYYYSFDYSGELNMRKKQILDSAITSDGTWGASIADELCYLFVCKPIKKSYVKALKDPDSEEIKVLRNMVRLWSNFARTGNPSSPGDEIQWTPATNEKKDCLVINEESEMKTNIYEERVQFWDNFIAKYRSQAVEGVVRDEL